jgi:PilZ domain
LLDISEGGVKLQITEPTLVPEEFILLLSRFGSVRRRCRVVWRSDDQLGAKFLDSHH